MTNSVCLEVINLPWNMTEHYVRTINVLNPSKPVDVNSVECINYGN